MTSPTTQEIADLIVAQLEGSLSQTIPLLPKAFNRVLAKVLAGVFILIYKYAGFVFLQMFVAHATLKATVVNGKTIQPLLVWGQLVGVEDPQAATRAEFVAAVNVVNQVGSLPAGTKLIRDATGVIYESIVDTALNAPQVGVQIRAVSDSSGGDGSGVIGNMEPGTIIQFASTQTNVSSDVFITSQTVIGADAETATSYRTRVVNRIQAKPQGGAYADYRLWGEEVEGVAHVYPYSGTKPGEVDVFVEVDTDVDPDGLPDLAHMNAVRDSIELEGDTGKATRRPVGAAVNVLSIGRTAWEVQISGLDVEDEVSVKADIESGLDEYLRSREPFIVGLSVLPREDRITNAAIASIVNTIVDAAGGAVTDVQLQRSGVPVPSWVLTRGENAKMALNGITYI